MKYELIISVCLGLGCMGAFQAVMHLCITQNAFKWIDNTLKTRWFGADAWRNKHDWHIRGNYVFKYFPFIVVTDLFHFAHFAFGSALGATVGVLVGGSEITIAVLSIASSTLYSAAFELFYAKILRK